MNGFIIFYFKQKTNSKQTRNRFCKSVLALENIKLSNNSIWFHIESQVIINLSFFYPVTRYR